MLSASSEYPLPLPPVLRLYVYVCVCVCVCVYPHTLAGTPDAKGAVARAAEEASGPSRCVLPCVRLRAQGSICCEA